MRHQAHPTPPTALSFINRNRTDQASNSAMMTGHDDGSGASKHRHFSGTPNNLS